MWSLRQLAEWLETGKEPKANEEQGRERDNIGAYIDVRRGQEKQYDRRPKVAPQDVP